MGVALRYSQRNILNTFLTSGPTVQERDVLSHINVAFVCDEGYDECAAHLNILVTQIFMHL